MTAIRSIPQSAIDLVKHFEGFSSKPYVCPAGFLTIGYGHVVPNDYPRATRVTPEEAEDLLRKDLRVAALGVLRLTKVPLSDNQYGALVSFVFNLGAGRYQSSTLRMKINRGDYSEAAEEFPKWVYGGGRKLPGLVARRDAEARVFSS